jgi:phenylpyruvate tautomerase PptA (4-oxalocrotonate tautomerase family)
MPLVRISHPTGANASAISQGVHRAMVTTFNVPEDDFFQIVTEHVPASGLMRPDKYLGIAYSDEFTIVQITANDMRTLEQKKALYAAIAKNLSRDAGLRREDILISLIEVKEENWSFGNGEAQYA